MISTDDTKLMIRVQTLGRSMVTNLYQLFRSAELYEENNDIFKRIAESMRSQIEESFRYLNSCNLKVTSHNIYISGNRIFIDFGILDSVRSLSKIFSSGRIGGMRFLEDSLDKHNLIRGLMAFRDTMVVDQRKGVEAIKKGMIDRHTPFIVPLAEDVHEVKVTGLRDELQAKKFAMRNALKLMIFLENMHESYQTGAQLQTTIIYRVTLNLIRVFEHFPSLVKGLLAIKVPNKEIEDQFYGSILLMVVLAHYRVERQVILNLVVDSLFHNICDMAYKDQFLTNTKAAEQGAKKLLETRFINRNFFFRVNFAFHTPLLGKDTKALDFTQLFKTIKALIIQLKAKELLQTAIINLLKSQAEEIHKPSALIIARALGLLPPGLGVILDGKKPAVITHWSSEGDEGEVEINTIDPVITSHIEKLSWFFDGEKEWLGYLKRLHIPSPTLPAPNPVGVIFME